MIVLFQIFYVTFQKIYESFAHKIPQNNDKTSSSSMEQSEVTPKNENALEYVLKFDPPMYCQRYWAVQHVLVDQKWRGKLKKVVDFGCSEYGFFNYLKHVIGVQEILFVDIDKPMLEHNMSRIYPLTTDYLCRRKEPLNISILCGSISNPSLQVMNVDAVCCIEIIEHVYPDTLDALPYNIFGVIKPRIAIFTTPNSDFNVLFPNFCGFRHYDHKFEWSREQFKDWAYNVVSRFPEYSVSYQGIGAGPKGTEIYGECSQMVVFAKNEEKIVEESYQKIFYDEQSDIDNKDCKFCKYEQENDFTFLSSGVCTYLSYSNQNSEQSVDNEGCSHTVLSYEEVGNMDFPHEVDHRTQEERILHNAQYGMNRLAHCNGRYNKDELDQAEIPLYELVHYGEAEVVTVSDLSNILQKAGYTVEECNVEGTKTLCVIHPYETMSKSSHRTRSTENSDVRENYDAWEDENQWDDESNLDHEIAPPETEPPPTDTSETPKKHNEIGEASGASSPKKLECLYDSGCQISSSSIDLLTPELLRSMQLDRNDRRSDTFRAKSEPESLKSMKNPLKRQTMNNSNLPLTVMKSDGNMKLQKSNVGDILQDEVEAQPVQEPIEQAGVPVIENGDLANNNRDGEGNNYPENQVENVNDNAAQRLVNEEENAVIINEDIELEEFNLENVSQEALFDPNSENSLSEIDLLLGEQSGFQPFYTSARGVRMPINITSAENLNRDPSAFPTWLLHLLNISESDSDSIIETEPHFYSQGDGLGIHPSISDLSTDSSSTDASVHASNVLDTSTLRLDHSISDNENSEDYFSVDDGNALAVGQSELTFDEPLVFSESEIRFLASENKEATPEQSTSKKKD